MQASSRNPTAGETIRLPMAVAEAEDLPDKSAEARHLDVTWLTCVDLLDQAAPCSGGKVNAFYGHGLVNAASVVR